MPELNIVEKVIALEGVELLTNLTADQLLRIVSIAEEVNYPPRKTIFKEDEAPDALYVILDGAVEMRRGEEILHVARQSEVLGSWALLDDTPIPVSATAIDPAKLLRIRRDDFFDLLADDPRIMSSLFSTLVKRFRAMVAQ